MPFPRLRLVALVALGLLVGPVDPAEAAGSRVAAGGPQILAGGLASPQLGGLAIARDGTGGLVWSASVGGVPHAYLSRLFQGDFLAPVQLDAGAVANTMPGASTSPVVAADNAGDLLLAFLANGNLYTEESSNGGALSAPQLIAAGASNPSIAMNLFGVGYLAFSAPAPSGGNDVNVWFWNGTAWAPASPQAMNVTPGDDAGTGRGAPSVAAATDGVGIVAWGEAGHVFSRRIRGTQTSVETEQDDTASLGGQTETGATAPQVAVGGDSSYPDIVYEGTFTSGSGSGSQTQTRAMLTRLIAEQTHPVGPVDAATTNGGGAEPTIAMGEAGRGIIGAATTTATAMGGVGTGAVSGAGAPYGVSATVLGQRGQNGAAAAEANTATVDPHPAAAVFGSVSSGLAWVGGGTAAGQVQLAYATDGNTLAPPVALSTAAQGAVQGAAGLVLAGDDRGDAAAAWIQGNGNLVTDELYTPPGTPGLTPANVAADTSSPVLDWNPAAEDLGPVLYTVSVSNGMAQATNATATQLAGVTDGRYSFSVQATNRVNQSGASANGVLVVDTYAPHLRVRLLGTPRPGALQRLRIAGADVPNPAEPGAVASGIRHLSINWGDGTPTVNGGPGLAEAGHAYRLPGLYTVSVTVTDAVANQTTLTHLVRVLP